MLLDSYAATSGGFNRIEAQEHTFVPVEDCRRTGRTPTALGSPVLQTVPEGLLVVVVVGLVYKIKNIKNILKYKSVTKYIIE